MDPNETLRLLRQFSEEIVEARDTADEDAVVLAERFLALDSWLRQGGFPPEAWTEGPDAHPEHVYVLQPIWRPKHEPLGPPNPAGAELPE